MPNKNGAPTVDDLDRVRGLKCGSKECVSRDTCGLGQQIPDIISDVRTCGGAAAALTGVARQAYDDVVECRMFYPRSAIQTGSTSS